MKHDEIEFAGLNVGDRYLMYSGELKGLEITILARLHGSHYQCHIDTGNDDWSRGITIVLPIADFRRATLLD